MKKHYFAAYAGLPREVYFLFAARLVNSMGYFVSPLLTLILTQKIGMSKAEAGTTVALLILTQAPCVLMGGKLADAIGRKRTLLLGSLAGAAFYLLCGLGFTGRTLIAGIILAADCTAVSVPAFDALLADLTKPEERQSAYSLLYLGVNVGMAASPLIGGLLFNSHLSLLFVLDAVTTFAAVSIVAVNVPETFSDRKKTQKETTHISLYAALRRTPLIVGFVFLLFLYDFSYSQVNFMLPAQFGDLFAGDGARLYSVLSSVNAATVIVITPLITFLTRRMRPLRAVALAGIFYIISYIGFCVGGKYPFYFFLMVVFTLGEICAAIQVGAFISNRAPQDCLGRINAFSTLMRGSSTALGPLLMGQLLMMWDYPAGWLMTAGIALAAAAGFALLDRRDQPAG
ncbi:MAG: MFS transporter [Oscillibacter sp.]|nr:MFS transporter [Oscillibacter sp.]